MKNEELIIRETEDGGLEMENAKTIERYEELKGGYDKNAKKTETDRILANPAYFFAAFNDEQYNEGKAKMIPHLKEGEKIVRLSIGGCYMSETGLRLFTQAQKSMKQRIKEECDPQEVYCYEFNNYECMYDYDGDERAIELIIGYFGKGVARSVRRYGWPKKEIK